MTEIMLSLQNLIKLSYDTPPQHRYCISKDYWKEGLGTEVVDAIIHWVKAEGGKSITGEVADINLASIALLHKFGFLEDRKTRYKNGEKKPISMPII